jgi:hypothetical protein
MSCRAVSVVDSSNQALKLTPGGLSGQREMDTGCMLCWYRCLSDEPGAA